MRNRTYFTLFLIACAMHTAFAKSTSKTVDANTLPGIVLDSIHAKYPSAEIQSVAREKLKGPDLFTIELKNQSDVLKIEIDEDGNISTGEPEPTTLIEALPNLFKKQSASKSNKRGRIAPTVYGYSQVWFRRAFETGSDGVVDNSNFRVMRVRIGFKGVLTPILSYAIEIDPRSPEINGVLRDAYFDVKLTRTQLLRAGQQKTQYGYENLESSTNLYQVFRTELSESFGRAVTLRDQGIGLIGHIPLNHHFRIENGITLTNGTNMNAQDDPTDKKNLFGRVGIRSKTSAHMWRLGASYANGDYIDPGNDLLDPSDDLLTTFSGAGIDFEMDHKRFFMSAEYGRGTEEADGETADASGYYVNLVGKTAYNMGPSVRYDVFEDIWERWTIGAYYGEPKSTFRILLNYEYRAIVEDLLGNTGRGDDKLILWTQFRF